jgi:hypothetical protein
VSRPRELKAPSVALGQQSTVLSRLIGAEKERDMEQNKQDKEPEAEAKISQAEATLKDMKVKTNVKLGPIPFIAGASVKSSFASVG